MGYYLQAFICEEMHSDQFQVNFEKVKVVKLGQGICLIPMTEELFDEINRDYPSPGIEKFVYLTEYIEERMLSVVGDIRFAYIEAEYHGGQGGQTGIIWSLKKREMFLPFGDEKINEVLRKFGAKAKVDMDEFLTLGFGMRRDTSEW